MPSGKIPLCVTQQPRGLVQALVPFFPSVDVHLEEADELEDLLRAGDGVEVRAGGEVDVTLDAVPYHQRVGVRAVVRDQHSAALLRDVLFSLAMHPEVKGVE